MALLLCLSGLVSTYASTTTVSTAVYMGRKLLANSTSWPPPPPLVIPAFLSGVLKSSDCYTDGYYYYCTSTSRKNYWWVYFIVCMFILALVVLIVVCVVIRRRRFRKSMEMAGTPPNYPYGYAQPLAPGSSAPAPVQAPPSRYGSPPIP